MPRLHDNTRTARQAAAEEDRFDFEEETIVMERIYGSFGCACDLNDCEWHTGARDVTSSERPLPVASSRPLLPDPPEGSREEAACLACVPVQPPQ